MAGLLKAAAGQRPMGGAPGPGPMAPTDAMGGAAPAPEDGDGETPNVSPEEQAKYDRFVTNGMRAIFNEKTAPAIVQRIKQSPNPVEGLAATTVQIVTRLKQSAEQKGAPISNEVLVQGGAELLSNIAELAGAAGVEFTDEQIEQASYVAMDLYGTQAQEAGTLDKDGIAREFQTMLQADKEGRIDDILPGLSGMAKKVGAKKKPGPDKPGMMARAADSRSARAEPPREAPPEEAR